MDHNGVVVNQISIPAIRFHFPRGEDISYFSVLI